MRRTESRGSLAIRSRILAALLFGSLLVWAGGALAAQPVCTGNEHLISWPSSDPLWEMCWLRPPDSSGGNGSGIELRDVHYRGQLVLKRAHAPIVNVDYDAGGCGCFRDWEDREVQFVADNEILPGYAEPTSPPLTVCTEGGSGWDVGTFFGVASEKNANELILTSQMKSGWYRYDMRWVFKTDGRILPFFGFATVASDCTQHTHRHHNYYRFDFDVIDADNDNITEINDGVAPLLLQTESVRTWVDGNTAWEVTDSTTGLGYRVRPGADDILLPADEFSVADAWVLRYNSVGQYEDLAVPVPPSDPFACRIRMSAHADGQSTVNEDLVLWYRGGGEHISNEIDDCQHTGPILEPMGNWVDTDNDTVENQDDNCPFTSNPAQADFDDDGIGDACDSSTTPTPTPTTTPTATTSATPTATPTINPDATPTASPTVSPTVGATATPTSTPPATPTASPTGTPTSTPSASATAEPTATPSVTPTPPSWLFQHLQGIGRQQDLQGCTDTDFEPKRFSDRSPNRFANHFADSKSDRKSNRIPNRYSYGNAHCHGDSRTDRYAKRSTYADADCELNRFADSNPNRFANHFADGKSDRIPNRCSYGNANRECNRHTNCDSHCHGDSRTDRYAYCFSDNLTDRFANCVSDNLTDRFAYCFSDNLTNRFAYCFSDNLTNRFAYCFSDNLTDRFAYCVSDNLTDRFAYCVSDNLTDDFADHGAYPDADRDTDTQPTQLLVRRHFLQ